MFDMENHPSLEMIMDFVSLTPDVLDKTKFGDYADMIMHFAECEKCREIKDEMVVFSKHMDTLLSEKLAGKMLKLKIRYSLERLKASDEWKNNKILLSARGIISRDENESVIKSIEFESETENNMGTGAAELYSPMINPDTFRISLGSERAELLLPDDGMDKHSVLFIPENVERNPMLLNMVKDADSWQVSCDCPEDEYDIVVF